MRKILTFLMILLISSCTTTGGPSVYLVDYNKNTNHYRAAEEWAMYLRIGMPKSEIKSIYNEYVSIVESTEKYETWGVAQWEAIIGNDPIIRVLYLKITNGLLEEYRIVQLNGPQNKIPVIKW